MIVTVTLTLKEWVSLAMLALVGSLQEILKALPGGRPRGGQQLLAGREASLLLEVFLSLPGF